MAWVAGLGVTVRVALEDPVEVVRLVALLADHAAAFAAIQRAGLPAEDRVLELEHDAAAAAEDHLGLAAGPDARRHHHAHRVLVLHLVP